MGERGLGKGPSGSSRRQACVSACARALHPPRSSHTCPGSRRPQDRPHLTFASQAGLLQPRPDALDAPGVLRVAVGVPAGALVLQHQRVVHEACSGGGRGGRAQRSPRGTRQLVPLPGERSSGHLPNGQSPRHPGEPAREKEMKRQPCPQDSGLSYHRDRADPDSGEILVPNSGLPGTLSTE